MRVIPDGCVDLVWRHGAGTRVAGPDTRHWLSECRPDELLIGVRFLPGAGGPALGISLEELRDDQIRGERLGPLRGLGLGDDRAPREVWRRLPDIATELVGAGPPDRAVQYAAARLLNPAQRVEPLSDELGVSDRHLRRRFHAAVGYGPKTLQRVLRLRRFLSAPDDDLARAAAAAGYSDQAHLTRECRRLTGLSPSLLLSERRAGPDVGAR
ncbi:MAG: helix-turn-helix domain-containing protein [Solirubrobacterales bacterium]|nr:helix-turn-helix domain-containing protein [Solirubrobacterales bacterium]